MVSFHIIPSYRNVPSNRGCCVVILIPFLLNRHSSQALGAFSSDSSQEMQSPQGSCPPHILLPHGGSLHLFRNPFIIKNSRSICSIGNILKSHHNFNYFLGLSGSSLYLHLSSTFLFFRFNFPNPPTVVIKRTLQ